jgi:hypothetical protein
MNLSVKAWLMTSRNLANLKDMAHKIIRRPPHINGIQKIIDKLADYDRKFADLASKMKVRNLVFASPYILNDRLSRSCLSMPWRLKDSTVI